MAERTCFVVEDGVKCNGITGVPGTARGMCNKHYNRWRRHRDVTVVKKGSPGRGSEHYAWKGEQATYTALHNRVYRLRGKAGRCERCGRSDDGTRYEWAMIHGTDGTDVHEHYRSLCQVCHRTYDTGKTTPEQRAEIRRRVAAGESQASLAREFGIDKSVISRGLSVQSRKWGSQPATA